MNLPRRSTFPIHKPFEKQEPTTSLSEVALRVVVNFYSDTPQVIGTATVLCGNLLLTARHVLFAALDKAPDLHAERTKINKALSAVQLLPGPEYIIWDVVDAVADPATDLALLRLAKNPGRSHPEKSQEWRALRVNCFAPEIGERVAAFGYRKSVVRISKNNDGGNHIELNDEPIMSVRVVREIFEWRRDSAMLSFPCYEVSARFDNGMSGGPVFDETGSICGVVCAHLEGSHLDGNPVSYVTTLWPLFRMMIETDRGDNYPRGVRYPVIELARGGQIGVTDLPRLEQWFTRHIGQPPKLSK